MTKFLTILVGNGRSLLDSPRGAMIDSFDVVVRFNRYCINAEFTGKRTTVWAINRNILKEDLWPKDKGAKTLAVVHYGPGQQPWLKCEQVAVRRGYDYLPREVVREAFEFFGKWQPTTGALVLGHYAKRGGCALIAFDRMEVGPIHWYDSVRHKPRIHNADLEQKWIERHVKSGKAMLL